MVGEFKVEDFREFREFKGGSLGGTSAFNGTHRL
jgi:hypothetical protein